MQKLISISQPNGADCARVDEDYLKNGWVIKNMISVDLRLIILLEKETRKEKLEYINSLNES